MKQKKQFLVGVAVFAGIAVVASMLFKKKPEGRKAAPPANGAGFVTPTLDFRSLANQLFDSFDGYGTDNDVVRRVFKMLKTDGDYDALKAAYGVREVSSGRFNIFVSDFEGDLPSTLRSELSAKEVAEINQILTSNRISRSI